MGADKKKAGPVNYTPIERLLLTSAPLAAAVEMVLDANAAGQIHELGLYVKRKTGAILTMNQQTEVELVGIRIPLDLASELRDAFVAAKSTPLGDQLHRKIRTYSTTS